MCSDEILALISGHIDACNTEQEEAQLREHLKTCEPCRRLLATYEQADCGIAALEQEVPDGFTTAVMDAVRQTPQAGKKKSRRLPFGRGTAIAAVAAALLLVLGAGRLWIPEESTASISDATLTQDTQTTPAKTPADAALEAGRAVDSDAANIDCAALAEAENCQVAVIYGAQSGEFSELQCAEALILDGGAVRYRVTNAQIDQLDAAYGDGLPIVRFQPSDFDDSADAAAYLIVTPEAAP